MTLHALLRHVGEETPGLHLELHELTTPEQLSRLTSARLDAGLVHHPVDVPDLRSGPVVEIPLGVVLPRTSPLALARPDPRPGSRPGPGPDPWPQSASGSGSQPESRSEAGSQPGSGSRAEAGSQSGAGSGVRSEPEPQPESRRPRSRPWEIALADLAGHDLVVFPRETSPAWYDRMLDTCRAGVSRPYGFSTPATRSSCWGSYWRDTGWRSSRRR